MNKVFECIGALVLAIIMLGIPVLLVLTLVFSWGVFMMVISFLLTMADVLILFIGLCAFADFLSD